MKENYELGNANKSKLCLVKEANKYDYKMENFKYDPSRKNDSHISIINIIEEKSTVLDVGCATGLIANILFQEKNCIVDGIEYDLEAFKICKNNKSFRNVYNFSITNKENKEYKNILKNNKYDYIILADILEHLVNPWEVLINLNECLKENGKIIISLPNIGHIDIIKGLINGNFNYNDLGLLDTTHLRFFTFKSFCDMISNIAEFSNVYYNVERKDKILSIPAYVTNAEDYALYNINSFLEEYFILQNIIVLTKAKDKKVCIKGIDDFNKDLFEKMIKRFKKIQDENAKLVKENAKLANDMKRLKIENEELKKICNSKRFKFINNFCNFFKLGKK